MTQTNGYQILWGDLFEIAVKRGVISCLLHYEVLPLTDPALKPWTAHLIRDLRIHLDGQLAATDAHYLQLAHHWLDHLLVFGYGLGWTCMRQILQRFDPSQSLTEIRPSRRPKFEAIWCPLNLPDRRSDTTPSHTERLATLHAFWQAMHLNGTPKSDWLVKGQPANADFLLLLNARHKRYLLCLEFSLNSPPHPYDFTNSETHLRELEAYVRRIENRGVFTRLNMEVTGDSFAFDPKMASYLSAFSGTDKPLYKLCQASSYINKLVQQLRQDDPQHPVDVQAVAITQSGVEGLAARFDATNNDPRIQLLAALGATYTQRYNIDFTDPTALASELRGAFKRIKHALPQAFKQELTDFLANPPIGQELRTVITETVTEFQNPDQTLSLTDALRWVNEDAALIDLLGQAPRGAISQTLHNMGKANAPCLRDLHAAAVQVGLNAAKPGKLNLIALEGHPGIGKTTAIKDWLYRQNTGFLFIYMSPRIVINSKLLTELAEWYPTAGSQSQLSNILTLTSSKQFMAQVRQHHTELLPTTKRPQHINGAVAFAGVDEAKFKHPNNGIVFLNCAETTAITQDYTGDNWHNIPVSETRSQIHNKTYPGVWRTLGTATRDVLEANPQINRLALTAAIQGYRALGNRKTTVDGLSTLFKYPPHNRQARSERMLLAQRLATIVVMLDEIAGDSAGTLAAQDLATWLHQQFLEPFTDLGEQSPFRLILVVADASLGNAAVFQRHLESGVDSPDKILISSSSGPRPFSLAVSKVRLNANAGSIPTLHIMADGFPARSPLTLCYDLRMLPLPRPVAEFGQTTITPRQLIRKHTIEQQQHNARELIINALSATTGQVIFFAQDRTFIETVANQLKIWAAKSAKMLPDSVVTLHSGTTSTQRNALIQPKTRDKLRVVLMTSSGSRGVSFPRTTHIIAMVPRFNVETALMELAQLIYRGRGYYEDPQHPGQYKSGDHEQRTLTFLIQDFVVTDPETTADERNKQWARQTLDLLTFIVLLRATVFTRLSGDAGMKQKLAIASVGRIGTDDLETLMANQINGGVQELQVLLADSNVDVDTKGGINTALEHIKTVFMNSTYRQWQHSIADIKEARHFSYGIPDKTQPLVTTPVQWIIPDNLYCLGPLWLERMHNVMAEELYEFDALNPQISNAIEQLRQQLWKIKKDRHLPIKLRTHAGALHKIITRDGHTSDAADPAQATTLRHTTAKSVRTSQYWNCLPVDYPRFMPVEATETASGQLSQEEQMRWWDTLHRAVAAICPSSSIFPPLPVYRGMPFLVIITSGDPTDLNRALDDRYFMASSEVNLLNALLFAAKT